MLVKRTRKIPKKSRARTKLSPLLENACSPIGRSHLPNPSVPIASDSIQTSTSAISLHSAPLVYSHSFGLPEISIQDHSTTHCPPVDQPTRTCHPSTNSLSMLGPTYSTIHSYTTDHHLPSPHYHRSVHTSFPQQDLGMGFGGSRWSGSSLTAKWDQPGHQIQCVPPRFIFAQKQSEGKVRLYVCVREGKEWMINYPSLYCSALKID